MVTEKDLQRYFDGELSPAKARKVYRELQDDPAGQQQLAEYRQLRSSLGQATKAAAEEANFDHLWTRVKANIKEEDAVRSSSRFSEWLRRYGLVVASLAVALVVGLIVTMQSAGPVSNDCVIESIETGPNALSTIMTIEDPAIAGEETTVIWVTETAADEGEP
jgi:anti-sigma factor RsiW